MRFLPAVTANVILLVSALGYGGLLSRCLPTKFAKTDRAAIALLGGLGVTGTLLFCVGQVWFSRGAILLVLALGILLCVGQLPEALRDGRRVVTARRLSSLPSVPLLIVGAVLLATIVGGLAEPVGEMENDAIAYHYLGPKVWLRDARIFPVPDEAQTAFPCVVEADYAALLSLGGVRAPQFFAVVGFSSMLLVIFSFAARLGLSSPGAWWAATLIISMPAVYRGGYGGFIDVLYAGFVLMAARVALDAEHFKDYALAGVLCGIAAGTKYTGLIAWLLLSVCCLLIATRIQRRGLGPALISLVLLSGAAFLVASPFYLRNWIVLGSPIYPPPPVFYKYFHVRYLPVEAIREYHAYILHRGAGLGRGLGAFLLLPFQLTYHTANFHGAGGIGLAPLALAPFGLLAAWRQWFAKVLALFALLATTAWFFTQQESRFLIPVYVLLGVLAALGWQYLVQRGSRIARALSALVLGISILYGLYMILPDRKDDLHAVVSSSFEAARRHEQIANLEGFQFLNTEPSVTKALILGPYVPALYLDKPYIKPVGRWGEQTLSGAADIQAILSKCHALGVSHVLDALPEYGPLRMPKNPPGLTLVFERDNERIYRVD